MKRVLWIALLVVSSLLGSAALAQDDMSFTVTLGSDDQLGNFLVDAEGMTLYLFTNDEAGVSNCSGDCAVAWPPLTLEGDQQPTLDPAISGQLGVFNREDGARQVTYNGIPLYYWQDDVAAGDTTGNAVGGVWFVVQMPQVGLGGNDDLGQFLVGPNGMTLYIFTNDEAGVSNCSGDCAVAWPPLTVESADGLRLQPGLAGEFSTIAREDGSLQVTLNDEPLYYWQNDAVAGDATGHEVGDVWFVAKLPTVATAETEDFGDILVGPNGMTLYLFTNDEAGVSNCAGGCATAWPPLTVAAGEALLAGEGVTGELATIEREDGSFHVTYDGMPLYYWQNDVIPGDTTGHDVGDVWFVIQPE